MYWQAAPSDAHQKGPECGEPAAETGELIRRQLGDKFGDFFDFHVAQYSTAGAWLSDGKVARPPLARRAARRANR